MNEPPSAVSCPVSGCSYTNSLASVAAHVSGKKDTRHDWPRLGYDGANHYKQEHKSTGTTHDPTKIGWLTDSHIGKKEGGYGRSTWTINTLDGLNTCIELLMNKEIDSLLYTGDLFHNDRDGISKVGQSMVSELIDQMSLGPIPMKYIKGNHAREEGTRAWESYEKQGIAEPLGTTATRVNDTAVYGIDAHSSDWWASSVPALQPSTAATQILCLHQSIEPFTSSSNAEVDIRSVVPQLSRELSGLPDIVLLGHLHQRIDRTFEITGESVRVLNCGATARLGERRRAFPPTAGLLEIGPGTVEYRVLTD